jgi:phage shock protein E
MRTKLLSLLILFAGLALIGLRSESVMAPERAAALLKSGAVLVDVRTPEEFKSKSLAGAVNIPVDQIKTGITNVSTDKSRMILLHCRTGRRSGIAETELRSIGYTNAFNIGSYEQAEAVVKARDQKKPE